MKRILIDTNALMAIGEWKIDLFLALEEECDFLYTIAVLQGTINELQFIQQEQRGKYQAAAKLALALLKAKKVTIIPSGTDVDGALVEYSHQGYLVLTQDIPLKKRLAKPYLTIRQKKKVITIK
mgnify:CR=1 FL=1